MVANVLAEYLHRERITEIDLGHMQAEHTAILRQNPTDYTLRMSHNLKDIAEAAYAMFLLDQETGKIRDIIDIGLRIHTSPNHRSQPYHILVQVESARGNADRARDAQRQVAHWQNLIKQSRDQ